MTETPTATPALSESPSPSPTPSPSATALTEEDVIAALPDGAMTADIWGAFAYASTLVTESRAMVLDGDTRLFEAMSSDTCTFCTSALDYARSLDSANETLTGGQIKVQDADPRGGLQTDGTWQVEFDIVVDAATVLNDQGAPVFDVPESRHTVAVLMDHDGEAWSVRDVGSQEL
ncbi:DUF6318 family protein [Demequina muriae]|uniref:DUF6318 family protein n=1 Tax=Demequina muriae TaxID=3051664 RepID=A0ABT8GE78_9MICO|nr:DUF6318 family protein [Demequina sp. EGI L300058]MDN4479735.1 DUF6318 family protein [Demequina sp. EGI L300058]